MKWNKRKRETEIERERERRETISSNNTVIDTIQLNKDFGEQKSNDLMMRLHLLHIFKNF